MLTARVVGGAMAGSLLLLAGLPHLKDVGGIARTLSRQGLIPSFAQYPVAVILTAVEVVTGFGLLVITIVPTTSVTGLSAVTYVAVALFGSMTAFTAMLVAKASDAPCGCDGSLSPPDLFTVLRAGIGFVAAGVVAASTWTTQGDAVPNHATAAVAGITLAWLVWHAPEALRPPTWARVAQRVRT